MSTLAPPPPTRRPSRLPRPDRARRGRGRIVLAGLALVGLIVLAPVVLFAGAGNPPCTTTATGPVTTPTGTPAAGQFAAPLHMQVGHWYRIGATDYGGPEDPTSGVYGASGAYLPDHPDSFAELSLLDENPANQPGGALTFSDADALGALPYGTAIRVANGQRSLVLFKRDVGYGQGPGQTIPYRIDVWWQAAAQLGVTKSPVQIELMPGSGSGALLGQLTTSAAGPASTGSASGCAGTPGGPLPITTGPIAQIDPYTGIASAPASAPAAVKRAIAAADQIIDRPYIWGGGHADLNTLAAGYDCSGASSYVLHHAGLYPPSSGPTAADFEHYYKPGPGRWITVYANDVHMFIVVAGVVLNTAWHAPVEPTDPTTGPRWQPASTVQAQIDGNAAAGHPAFSVTHPAGL